jgi:hypothetical protein
MASSRKKRRPKSPAVAPRFTNLTLLEPVDGVCLVCGCTDDEGCADGCTWVSLQYTNFEGWDILCSSCADEIAGTVVWAMLTHAGVVVR